MRRKTIINCTLVLAIGLGAFWVVKESRPRTIDLYNQLHIGLDKSEVQLIFGKPPDYICRYKNYEIWYLNGPSLFNAKIPHHEVTANQLFESPEELPDLYGHITLAFTDDSKLYAFTWIGESYFVEFDGGVVRGTHFRLIPPASF